MRRRSAFRVLTRFVSRYDERVRREFPESDEHAGVASSLLEWFHKMVTCYDSVPNWFELSAKGITLYNQCEGNPLMNWKDKGYRILFDVLMVSTGHVWQLRCGFVDRRINALVFGLKFNRNLNT